MSAVLRTLGLASLALLCASALIGWNFSRFVGAKEQIFTKELDFLPSPEVARLLCFGHNNTVSKLRWIDSFAYFQLQLERRDDRLAGDGPGGFRRLYDTLIELDPLFEPFYQHAALCTGGLLGQNYIALGYLQRGLLHLPHETTLWRHAAAMLFANFDLEDRDPEQMGAFLDAWKEAEATPERQQQVLQWKAKMGLRKFKGLEQIPYWQQQLEASAPGTPMGDFIEGVMREQLTNYTLNELTELLALHRQRHGADAKSISELLDDPQLFIARYGKQLPAMGPFAINEGRLALKSDPYGFNFRLDSGKPVSPGLERERFGKQLALTNVTLEEQARATGKRPTTLAEVTALGITLPTPPPSGRLLLNNQVVVVEYGEGAGRPWGLRQLPR